MDNNNINIIINKFADFKTEITNILTNQYNNFNEKINNLEKRIEKIENNNIDNKKYIRSAKSQEIQRKSKNKIEREELKDEKEDM